MEIFFFGLILILPVIFLYITKNRVKGIKKTNPAPPEPAGAWPLVGHLRLLGPDQLLHRTLGAMAEAYGSVLAIRLGAKRAVVISDRDAAKQCFTTNDKVISSRPMSLAVKIAGYGDFNPGFSPYSSYWRNFRKLAVSQLLSAHRLELRKHVRDTEINFLIKGLYRKCLENNGSALVEMMESFGNLSMNIVLRSVADKRYEGDDEESERVLKAFCEWNRLIGIFFYSDAIPVLGWLDSVNGSIGELKKNGRELDYYLGKWVKEHREKRLAGRIDESEQDFMHVMLSSMEDERPAQEVDTIIKATCLGLIAGGSDSTTITLTWALSLLLNNGRVLKAAQDELDAWVGRHRQVEESDINNLTYIKAIIKETLRLYPPVPLSVARETTDDITISGFHVPKGTQLLFNLWKLHRSPKIWKNPSEFVPERFLEEHEDLDVRGQDFEYLPFGSGRRMCPGVTFGSQVLHLTLARLIHTFELGKLSDQPVDMTEGPGLTLPKETPLEVVLTPRLPENVLWLINREED